MIYLLRTFGRDNKTALKIGYTDDKNSKTRLSTYRNHNLFYELITTIKGAT